MPLLTKPQANDLFLAIENRGLDPRSFRFNDGGSSAVVQRVGSTHLFVVSFVDGQFHVDMTPGAGMPRSTMSTRYWSQVMSWCSAWLAVVKADISAPDLWANLTAEDLQLFAQADNGEPNATFTAEQQSTITARLDALEQQFAATTGAHDGVQALLPDLQRAVNEMRETLPKLPRRSWFHAALGVLLSVLISATVNMTVTPATGQHLVRLFLGALAGVHLLK